MRREEIRAALVDCAQGVGAMNAVTLKEAKRNLEELVEQVIADAEPTIVVTESGEQVVFLPLDEYKSLQETLHLLGNPANAEHLRRSIAEDKAGRAQEQKKSLTELAGRVRLRDDFDHKAIRELRGGSR